MNTPTQRQQGREVLRLEHGQEQVVALNAREAQKPGGEGGADVGAKDHVEGLGEVHDAGVDQTYQHDRGGRGRLHGNGNDCAESQADEGIGGHFLEGTLQLAAGEAL